MNFKQLTLLLCVGTGIAYSDVAHAMNDEDIEPITPASIARMLNEFKKSNDDLTSSVSSLKQQLDEQGQNNVRLTEKLDVTQIQLNKIEQALRVLLTSDPAAPSNP